MLTSVYTWEALRNAYVSNRSTCNLIPGWRTEEESSRGGRRVHHAERGGFWWDRGCDAPEEETDEETALQADLDLGQSCLQLQAVSILHFLKITYSLACSFQLKVSKPVSEMEKILLLEYFWSLSCPWKCFWVGIWRTPIENIHHCTPSIEIIHWHFWS